jgi:hypothetical protein
MKNIGRKKKKVYYIVLLKINNKVAMRLTKQGIAEFIGITVKTINRHLDGKHEYHSDVYSLWCNMSAPLIKRGFKLKPITMYHRNR